MEPQVKCPHCGELFGYSKTMTAEICGKIPTHDYPKPCRSVCPGSLQQPRSIEDRRPLWKDDPELVEAEEPHDPE